jgi:riboflavin transporter FmnP
LSRKIAFTGILTCLTVIFLYISVIVPTGKLTLYFLASLPVSFAIVEFGAGAGISVYFAACN